LNDSNAALCDPPRAARFTTREPSASSSQPSNPDASFARATTRAPPSRRRPRVPSLLDVAARPRARPPVVVVVARIEVEHWGRSGRPIVTSHRDGASARAVVGVGVTSDGGDDVYARARARARASVACRASAARGERPAARCLVGGAIALGAGDADRVSGGCD
jgi:hypothetical protein